MRRAILLVLMVAAMMVATVPMVSAHVHGITPLTCEGVGNANSGGNGTDGTPADDANGGPISGLIPRDTGNAPIDVGDGGFRPANNPHCR